MKNRLFFTLLMIGLCAVSAAAQSATGRLVGTVSGPDGVLPNATIVIVDDQTKQSRTITSNGSGSFSVSQISVGTYTVTVTATGFKTYTATGLKIDVGQEYSFDPVLEVGGVQETVEVTAGADVINSTNAELSNTISQTQLLALPINGRDPSSLIQLQPGVTQGGNVDGLRSSAQNITRDGLNVQDNYIRSGDFNPDRPRIDDVQEFTVTTQNASAAIGSGGSSQIQYVTPRGGATIHGALFEYNQNAALASNGFFNNRNGIERPPYNQNQYGGKLSGPVYLPHFGEGGPAINSVKGLFFFYEYEGFRLPQTQQTTRTILTPLARQGIFQYFDDNGNLRQYNILTAQGLSVNPVINSRVLAGLPTTGNNDQVGDGLNTTGYTFNQRADVKLNNSTTRVDYDINPKNTANFVWKRTSDNFLRPDTDSGGFNTVPFGTQTTTTNTLVGAYNTTFSSRFNNEVRGGYQHSNPFFNTGGLPSNFFISLPLTDSPENSFLPQGRDTKLYNIQDNAVYTLGNHSIRFGAQDNIYRIKSFGAATIPTYFLDNSFFPNYGYTTPDAGGPEFSIPGLSDPNQIATANALQSELAGLVGEAQNTFNVTSRTSGFVPNAPQNLSFNYSNISFYGTDEWRIRPNLTVNVGVRYELFTHIVDPGGLRLEVSVPNGSDATQALLNPNGTYNFIGGNAGKNGAFTKTDKNNFAPNISIAYSPNLKNRFLRAILPGESKTVIRAGYRSSYINDEFLRSQDNALQNQGLSVTPTVFLADSISNPSTIPVPTFNNPPLTYSSINALAPGQNVAFLIDPKLQVPRVDEYNIGIQRNLGSKAAIEIRYVGNRSKELIRVIDYNQIDIRNNGFLADYNRARSNFLLTGNAACTTAQNAGCQALTVFPNLVGGGSLNSSAVRNLLLNGSVADLARRYVTTQTNGSVQFLPNPNIGILDLLGNLGRSNYNALQVEFRRRFADGFLLQANYTFQKTLTDISPGNPGLSSESQTRVAAYLDNANKNIDYGRADFDQTQIFNLNGVLDLPFGKGKYFATGSGVLNQIIGGFQLGGILRINTGTPLSFVDPRGTLNRVGRSANQTAQTNLTQSEINGLVGIFRQNGNIYYINPSVINPANGRGASAFGSNPFSGQVFFDNAPGQEGGLGRTNINGPLFTQLDLSLTKTFTVKERLRFQLRADVFNVLNHTNFLTGTLSSGGVSNDIFNINSTTFGQITTANGITGVNGLNRVVQLAGRFEF